MPNEKCRKYSFSVILYVWYRVYHLKNYFKRMQLRNGSYLTLCWCNQNVFLRLNLFVNCKQIAEKYENIWEDWKNLPHFGFTITGQICIVPELQPFTFVIFQMEHPVFMSVEGMDANMFSVFLTILKSSIDTNQCLRNWICQLSLNCKKIWWYILYHKIYYNVQL